MPEYDPALVDRINTAIRSVNIRFGPNALAIMTADGTVPLSQGESWHMALAVADELSGEPGLKERAEAAEAERDQARATVRRLNYRCQQHESKIAALVRLVGNWRLSEKGTYVPLRNLTAIAKLAGRDIEGDRYELHYQRVEGLEDAITRAARILLRATADRASSRAALLAAAAAIDELAPKET